MAVTNQTASARRRSSHGMLVRRASPTDPVQKRPEITCLSPEGGSRASTKGTSFAEIEE